MITGWVATFLSLGVLGAVVLIWFGVAGLRIKGQPKLKPILMLAAAATILLNVYLIGTTPALQPG
jgi:hypothetical protein